MKTPLRLALAVLFFGSLIYSAGCWGGGGGQSPAVNVAAGDSNPDTSRIVSASLPLCKVGKPYEENSATHSPAAVKVMDKNTSYAFAIVSGTLPAGLTMDEKGVLSGTTTGSPGRYAFTMKVTDTGNLSHTFNQEMTLLVSGSENGIQPYVEIQKDPRAYYVHQDSALCGQTSFYMMLKYHGDTLPGAGPTNTDLCETIPNESAAVVSASTKVYGYLSSFSSDLLPGTKWSDLEAGSLALRKNSHALYPCIQSNPEGSENSEAGARTRTGIFDGDLVPFLETGAPVLIHLKRPYGVSGHYLVVIGYDSNTDEVMYLDPNDPQFNPRAAAYDPDVLDWSEAVRKVKREAFIGTAWYRKSGYVDAFWDGRWLGFSH